MRNFQVSVDFFSGKATNDDNGVCVVEERTVIIIIKRGKITAKQPETSQLVPASPSMQSGLARLTFPLKIWASGRHPLPGVILPSSSFLPPFTITTITLLAFFFYCVS